MKTTYLEFIFKGLLSGVLSAYLVIYGMRPAVPYPEIILEFFEHKWMLILLLIINYYIFIWDYTNGALFLLCLIAFGFDYLVFMDKGVKPKVQDMTKTSDDNREPVFVKQLPVTSNATTGASSNDSFNDIMMKKLNDKQTGQ